MPSSIPLSIIIINWNVRELLRKCIRSVRREMRLRADEYEVIVVDNASRDDSVAMMRAEFPEVTLIESPVNVGFGAGCNLAYRAARGEFVLLLNPDTELVDSAVDSMLEIMRAHPRAGIVAPRLMNPDRTYQAAAGGAFPTLGNVAWNYLFLRCLLPRSAAPDTLFIEEDTRELRSIDWVSGAAMMLRRAAAGAQIFDESFFMFGEDMDVCDRVRREGWEVLYAGEHSIVHHHGQSFAQQESPEIRAAAHGGPRRMFMKHHGPASVLAYDAMLFAGFLVRWPLFWVLSVVRPGRGYDARLRFSRSYLRSMLSNRAGPSAIRTGPDRS